MCELDRADNRKRRAQSREEGIRIGVGIVEGRATNGTVSLCASP
jgi:hypothetical protein